MDVRKPPFGFRTRVAGFVPVGGRSSRMGRDKALLPYGGGFLGQAVAGRVERAAGSVTLVGPPETYRQWGFPVLADAWPGEGPLGAVLTALEHSSAEWNLVVACDMPGVTVEFLTRLADAAPACGADALVPAARSGPPQPLCAVYHRRAGAHFARAFAAGVRSMREALAGLHTAPFAVDDLSQLANINTPEDWAVHAAG